MTLAEYYLADPRLVLLPVEHLAPVGMSPALAALLADRANWCAARIEIFNRAFALYWSRSASLAHHTRTWMPPRLRHVAVVSDPGSVRPYAQFLNTSAWTLYASDFDPELSDPEFAAYLFAHGVLDGPRFTELVQAGAAICACYAVDEARFAPLGAA